MGGDAAGGTFLQVHNSSYNTTFTTGNLRSLVSESAGWLVDGDADAGGRARALLAVVLSFAAGAVLGALALRAIGDHAVLLVIPVLLAVLASIVAGSRTGPHPPVRSSARRPSPGTASRASDR